MNIRKTPLICGLALLLGGCSLFHTTPPAVINGQRAVYQSVLIGEAVSMKLVDQYVKDSQRLVLYHTNYVFQIKLKDIDNSEEPPANETWRKSRQERRKQAEVKRDTEIKKSFDSIEKRATKMREDIKKHYTISLKLVSAVYNYLSTSPIEIDNMEFWINKLNQIANAPEELDSSKEN